MDKQQLLSLITNQLLFLGFDSAAQKLAKDANILNATPLNRLSEMLEGESFAIVPSNVTDYNNNLILSDSSSPSPDLVTWFTTTHKETVRIAVFNPDGLYLATASKDCSIKVLDVEKIRECYLQKNDVKPVVKTIYDHTGPVNDVCVLLI